VVRPENKVRKAQAKRKANPKRGTHFNIDDLAGKNNVRIKDK
jgi:hypothetical protein